MKVSTYIDKLKKRSLKLMSEDELDNDLFLDIINEGLVELFTRFPISLKEIYIQPLEWKTRYEISSKYAESNKETTGDKWISDSVYYPFKDDIVVIVNAKDENGECLPFNDYSCGGSQGVYTVDSAVIEIPEPNPNKQIILEYQALHDVVDLDSDIKLDNVILSALTYYVCYSFFEPYSGDHGKKSNEFYLKYKDKIDQIESMSLGNTLNHTPNQKFNRRGFV